MRTGIQDDREVNKLVAHPNVGQVADPKLVGRGHVDFGGEAWVDGQPVVVATNCFLGRRTKFSSRIKRRTRLQFVDSAR